MQSPPRTIEFVAIAEEQPGEKWRDRLLAPCWDDYKAWFLLEGDAARPRYAQCLRALREHMPEMLPLYERLVDLAGGGDTAARLLSLWKPTPYLAACSQVVVPGPDPALIRNSDYSPARCEGAILCTRWLGQRVLCMSDCLWGALDGVNESGLALSLTFGGRKVVGEGFGAPLILRRALERGERTRNALAILQSAPINMAYNVSVLDAHGDHATLHLSPDRAPVITDQRVVTNHQGEVEWQEYARATSSREREDFLAARLPHADVGALTARFLAPPDFSDQFSHGWGTLYTAVYSPLRRSAQFIWPRTRWAQSIGAFEEGARTIDYSPVPAAAPAGAAAVGAPAAPRWPAL